MSNSMPHVKWYGRDWLGDHQVRTLSLSERGMWIDLLCAMMSCEPYGHLAISGSPMPDEDAARMIGVDVNTYRDTLAKIERVGVSSRTSTGVLFSRRLVRDYQAYTKASESGRKGGGNPSLIRNQKPEAILQKPEAREALKAPIKVPIKDADLKWTEEQVIAEGEKIGVSKVDCQSFFQHYAPVNFVDGAGRQYGSLPHALKKWAANQPSRGKTEAKKSGLVNTWHDPNPDPAMRKAF